MAQEKKRTQAEKAVADSKKKQNKSKKNSNSTAEQKLNIPLRFISAGIFICLFINLMLRIN